MVSINTMFVPYKLVLSEGRPVKLEITVKNTSKEPKLLSLRIEVPYDLSLNSGGYIRRKEERLGEIGPEKSAKVEFMIFPRPTTPPGDYEIAITVYEHMDSYEYISGEKTKKIRLKVV